MTKPLFSICLIVKNEEKTLPRLLDSLKEFRDRGGDICIVDTGSTDNTPIVATNFGCNSHKVDGNRFRYEITELAAKDVNDFFIVGGEEPLVKSGDSFFDFASARNYAAMLTKHNMILSLDADEILTALDIDAINELIKKGYDKFEHVQVFTHNPDGSEQVKFLQSKFYDKRKHSWDNPVHEMLTLSNNKYRLPESVLKIEHFQNQESNRSIYPIGLAYDCFAHPEKDRNLHYLARELFWSNRLHSAEKALRRHLALELPPQEYPTTPTHMESLFFLGNTLGLLGDDFGEQNCYITAEEQNSDRREPFIRWAQYYRWHGRIPEARGYAEIALKYEWDEKYGVAKQFFADEPKEIIEWARKEYPFVSIIIPTLGRPDKLARLLDSIGPNAGYENYEVIVEYDNPIPDNIGVPKVLKRAVEKSKGDLVMFLGNDCIARKDFLKNAVDKMKESFPEVDGLVGLNDGYWYGEVYTHWLASKKLLPSLGGEFFHTGYHHTGCDSELTQMCRKLGKAVWAENARVFHDHPIQKAFKEPIDEVYQIAYEPTNRELDNILYHKRAELLGFEMVENFQTPLYIPSIIWTIWLNDQPIPEDLQKMIDSHKLDGFEHRMITLENCDRSSKYVQDCLSRNDVKGWVKASDYLRLLYLYNEGGIYVDAATDILKPFDLELLSCHLFACREDNGFMANGIIGAEPGHPVLKACLDKMDTFDGTDDFVFEYGMETWTKEMDAFGAYSWPINDAGIAHPEDEANKARIYTPEYFLPYNHQTGITNITENSYMIHRYLKSWLK